MAVSTGTVDNIKFGDDYGFFTIIHTSDGQPEVFILWFDTTSVSGGPIALYILLLTVAAARKLIVDISHDSGSALVTQVKMHA